jgi:tRNA (cytidine/uridine-2'-O-)-methyltransferase
LRATMDHRDGLSIGGSLRMRLALFQPDIPQNVGAAIRLCACLDVCLDLIEPCAFPLDDRSLRRAALDYGPLARVTRHASWTAFLASVSPPARLVLMSTRGEAGFPAFDFRPDDILLMGSESAGVPDDVYAAVQARLRIPIAAGARSLNVITAATLALGEALRQNNAYPHDTFPLNRTSAP